MAKAKMIPGTDANPTIINDAHVLLNSIVSQMTGKTSYAVHDTSSFVSVGNMVQRTGQETVLNAIGTVMGRTIFSRRPYTGKLDILRVDESRYGEQYRKLVPLSTDLEPVTSQNTAQSTPLVDGQSVDMYKINKPKAIQLNFYDSQACQKHITRFLNQFDLAFRSEVEFLAFWDAMMIEIYNSIESVNEAKRRALVLNGIAGVVAMGTNVIDLAAAFNAEYGTTYSRQQLLSEKLRDFMMYTASRIKEMSNALTDRTALYHAQVANVGTILHHTPKSMQRLIMFEPLFIRQQATVFPTLFNAQYLKIMRYEGVNFWQSPESPHSINVTPAILDTATGEKKQGSPQSLTYVLGFLYDEEFMGMVEKFSRIGVTPLNEAGNYWNIYWHWLFQAYMDFTENACVFVIGEGGAGQDDVQKVDVQSVNGEPLVLDGEGAVPVTKAAIIQNTVPVNVSQIAGNPTRTTTVGNPIVALGDNPIVGIGNTGLGTSGNPMHTTID